MQLAWTDGARGGGSKGGRGTVCGVAWMRRRRRRMERLRKGVEKGRRRWRRWDGAERQRKGEGQMGSCRLGEA